jgi:RNA polymerase-binding transcription factor
VKKPAVKKTSKTVAAPAAKGRNAAAKKAASQRAAATKSKPPARAKARPANKVAAKKAAAPKSTTGKKIVITKKAAPPPSGASKSAPPARKSPSSAKAAAAGKPAPAPAAATKPSPAKAAASPAAAGGKVAVPMPAVQPGPPLAGPNGFVPRKPGRGTPKYFVAPVQAPLPPPTSRFADRFAPPRPPTRQMNKQENDTPRQAHKADPKLANAWKTKAGRDLSDEELLAMPDSEYMNEKQLEFFRMKLQALKDDLLSNAGETTEHLREDTSIVPDPADRATIEEEHALELRTRDRERKLLKKISQSLGRIESGEYGFCDETGEPIGLGRLIARPTATLSLEAQQRRELKQKMFGD